MGVALLPGSVAQTFDPRPWQEMVEAMRGAGLNDMPEHGAWEDEPDEITWIDEATGYPCLMKRSRTGHWNGYVSVPRGHPWHGLGYSAELEGSTSPEELMDVHGGLTFADQWFAEGDWWFGFDCGHAWDISPAMPVYGFMPGDGYAYRDVAYVQGQVTHLAHQLKELE